MANLLERESEIATLRRAFHDAAAGQFRTVGLRGEPGVGKTRLLSEVTDLACRGGALVLAGRASELERDVPFALLDDSLAVNSQARSTLSDRDARALDALGAEPGPPDTVTGGPRPFERHAVARAVRALLETLSRERPVVLVLDDVHWADPASAEVLALLLHRPPRGAVLTALAARTGQAPTLESALAHAVRHDDGALLDLAPLSVRAVGRLYPDLSPAAQGELHQLTGGNPFYLEQLAESGARPYRAGQSNTPLGAFVVPTAVRAALAAEVDGLPAAARDLIRGAAVAGDPFEPVLAGVAAGLDPPEALAALDALLAVDLVRAGGAPGIYHFRHPLIRRAVYHDAGDGWLIGAHDRVAEALRHRGVAPMRRAYHVERAARPGDLDAVALLTEAADTALPVAPASAAGWYEAALRLLPADPRHADRHLALLCAQGPALASAGLPAKARDVLRHALSLIPPERFVERVRVLQIMVRLTGLWLGNGIEIRRLLEDELAALGDRDPRLTTLLTFALANDRSWWGDLPAALRLADDAASGAATLGDTALEAGALTSAAGVAQRLALSADPTVRDEVDRRMARAVAVADSEPDQARTDRLQTDFLLCVNQLNAGDIDGAARRARRALRLSEDTGQGLLASSFLVIRAVVHEERGQLQAAAADAAEALDSAVATGSPQLRVWASFVASRVALAQGDITAALEHATTGDTHSNGNTNGNSIGFTLADARLAAGDVAGAIAALDTYGWINPTVWPRERLRAVDVGVRVLIAAERRDDAARLADRAAEAAGARLTGTFAGIHARIRATVLLAADDVATAADVALAGAEAAAQAGTPLWAGRCRILAGQALAAQGRTDLARAELRNAAADLDALGAAGFRDAALRELRRLGDRPRINTASAAPSDDGLAVLTRREREVADLVAAGHSNAAIATRLYLSERTVEKHVSHLLAKLGLTTRIGVVRLLANAGTDRETV
ncbi:AAA family ATPase [Solwaraspora sp. WMMB762]|uniref:helix-turn-helix transcriptional regulator n=1 Tax=Solwaraspora sp. WMMB762 TaxID=3404120 RepID=UPI003B938C7E